MRCRLHAMEICLTLIATALALLASLLPHSARSVAMATTNERAVVRLCLATLSVVATYYVATAARAKKPRAAAPPATAPRSTPNTRAKAANDVARATTVLHSEARPRSSSSSGGGGGGGGGDAVRWRLANDVYSQGTFLGALLIPLLVSSLALSSSNSIKSMIGSKI